MELRTLQATARNTAFIDVICYKEFTSQILKRFRLYIDGEYAMDLPIVTRNESHSSQLYSLQVSGLKFIPGKKYEIATDSNFFVPVDISFLSVTRDFEYQYRYDGQLGAIYSKEKTIFRVFTPFSENCFVEITKSDGKKEIHAMNHDFDNGIFEIAVEGDLDGAKYIYIVEMFGQIKKVVDPYCYSTNSNSRYGYVINPERIKQIPNGEEHLPEFNDPNKAFIYECHVRDMTSLSNIENKGKFVALTKEGLTDSTGYPIGMDYIASLGMTHVQLLPVLDYQTVDDDNASQVYNWGYDPLFFFNIEGSYSTDPNDPYCRLIEFKNLVSTFHKKGLRVVLDVVYNHLFSQVYNSLSLLVPNYYQRFNQDGTICNGSGCGNDFESTHYMARKIIIESLLHLIDFYDVDGFRFDLMGLVDSDTILQAYAKIKTVKSDFLYYGEGWDMWTNLPSDKKTSLNNAMSLENVGFFNDRFRDVVKGKSDVNQNYIKGYLLGDTNYRDGFKHVLLGSCRPIAFAPLFAYSSQSINFVECHDNNTLFDKLAIACYNESVDDRLKRVMLCNATVIFSIGVPFIHAGQEIGQSKKGLPNTYNAGDEINGFDYALLDERKSMVHYLKDCIILKKRLMNKAKAMDIIKNANFEDLQNGALLAILELDDEFAYAIFNPSKDVVMYDFKEDVRLVFNESGLVDESETFCSLAIINGLSINVYLKSK